MFGVTPVARPLGRSGLSLSPVGFGTWAAGGAGWAETLGVQDDRETLEALELALDLGVNWIDTAPVYGLGHAEEVVGNALSRLGTKPLISTKCGFGWSARGDEYSDLREASIRKEVEASLRRLRVDVIDVYHVHWPLPLEQFEEGWSTLCSLRAEGTVRAVGVSNVSLDQLRRAQAIGRVDVLQAKYSLIDRGIEDDVLPYCAREDIAVVAYSPLAMGLLAGGDVRRHVDSLGDDDWRRTDPDFQEPRISRNVAIAQQCASIAERHNVSPVAVAYGWVLRSPSVCSAVGGFRRPSQVKAISAIDQLTLSESDLALLDDVSLSSADR